MTKHPNYKSTISISFPGVASAKEPICQCRRHIRDTGIGDPWVGEIPCPPGGGHGNLLCYSCLENLMNRGAGLLTRPSPEAERQDCNSRSQKARAGAISKLETASSTELSRFPAANHIFLRSWMVDICQEGHSSRLALQRRHVTHLRQCSCSAPRKPSV